MRQLLSQALMFIMEDGDIAIAKKLLDFCRFNLLSLQIQQSQLDQLIRRESFALLNELTESRSV